MLKTLLSLPLPSQPDPVIAIIWQNYFAMVKIHSTKNCCEYYRKPFALIFFFQKKVALIAHPTKDNGNEPHKSVFIYTPVPLCLRVCCTIG